MGPKLPGRANHKHKDPTAGVFPAYSGTSRAVEAEAGEQRENVGDERKMVGRVTEQLVGHHKGFSFTLSEMEPWACLPQRSGVI